MTSSTSQNKNLKTNVSLTLINLMKIEYTQFRDDLYNAIESKTQERCQILIKRLIDENQDDEGIGDPSLEILTRTNEKFIDLNNRLKRDVKEVCEPVLNEVIIKAIDNQIHNAENLIATVNSFNEAEVKDE